MNDINLYKKCGVDKDLKPLSDVAITLPEDKYYKAEFSPEFPYIKSFQPNQFTYARLTDETVSVLGRYHTSDDYYQISIVLHRNLKSGTYTFGEGGEDQVFANVISDGGIIQGRNGLIKLLRDNERQSIEATFNFKIESSGKPYKVINGKVSLLASGPL